MSSVSMNVKPRRISAFAIVAASLSCVGSLFAAADARFDDGGAIPQLQESEECAVTSSADAVPGRPGNGWLTAWGVNANSGSNRIAETTEVNPINGGGKYLSVEFSTAHKFPHRHLYIIRGYDAKVPPNRFVFDLRLDDISAFERENSFFVVAYSTKFSPISHDDFSQHTFPQDANIYWGTRVQSGSSTWLAYNSSADGKFDLAKYTDTGFAAKTNDSYHFEITINTTSNTWTVKIENLSDKTSYQSKPLGLGGSRLSPRVGYFSVGGGNIDGPAQSLFLKFSLDSLFIE